MKQLKIPCPNPECEMVYYYNIGDKTSRICECGSLVELPEEKVSVVTTPDLTFEIENLSWDVLPGGILELISFRKGRGVLLLRDWTSLQDGEMVIRIGSEGLGRLDEE